MWTRRAFLELLASIGVASPFVPLARPQWSPDQAMRRLRDGATFMYVHAETEIRRGDVVMWKGQHVGRACGPITKGHYGFVQIDG